MSNRLGLGIAIGLITVSLLGLGSQVFVKQKAVETLQAEVVSLNEQLGGSEETAVNGSSEKMERYQELLNELAEDPDWAEYFDEDSAMDEYYDEDDDYDYNSSEFVTMTPELEHIEGTYIADNYIMTIVEFGPGYEYQGKDATGLIGMLMEEIDGTYGYYNYVGACTQIIGGGSILAFDTKLYLGSDYTEESLLDDNISSTIEFVGENIRWTDKTNGISLFFEKMSF